MGQLSSYTTLSLLVMNWYCIKQNGDWNLYCLWLLVTVIIVGHCTILGAQSSFTQKQADHSSTLLILLSCICNWCNINAKLLNIIFVVDVAVSSESEFHECYVAHIMFVKKQCCFDNFCITVWERKGPGKTLTYFQGGEFKQLHYG